LIVNCRRVAKAAPAEGLDKNEGEKPKGTRVRRVHHYVESGDGTKLDGHGAGGAGPVEGTAPEGGGEHEPTFVADASPVAADDDDAGPFGFF
jgi:hypothetical protein